LFNQKIDSSNFKQPILIFDHLAQPFHQTKSKKGDFELQKGSYFFIEILKHFKIIRNQQYPTEKNIYFSKWKPLPVIRI
jgi:hypothetical protein